jgi:hypothetical protein
MAEGILGIVERRMQNTGESYAVALQTVLSRLVEIERDTSAAAADTSWVEAWRATDHPDPRRHMREMLLGMSPRMRATAVRFPPWALVVAKAPLQVPRPGSVGIIASYLETHEGECQVAVQQSPSSGFAGYCLPDELEVVGFRGSITSDLMRELVDELRGPR